MVITLTKEILLASAAREVDRIRVLKGEERRREALRLKARLLPHCQDDPTDFLRLSREAF